MKLIIFKAAEHILNQFQNFATENKEEGLKCLYYRCPTFLIIFNITAFFVPNIANHFARTCRTATTSDGVHYQGLGPQS